MMRRFAITTFAVLYAVWILSASAERTGDWAAREAAALSHQDSSYPVPSGGQVDKFEPRDLRTKILEPEFVVESPREAIVMTMRAERYIPLSLFVHCARWSGRPFASRAPPSIV